MRGLIRRCSRRGLAWRLRCTVGVVAVAAIAAGVASAPSAALASEGFEGTVFKAASGPVIGPLAGVEVWLCEAEPCYRPTFSRIRTTDSSGKYKFEVGPGEYVVYFAPPSSINFLGAYYSAVPNTEFTPITVKAGQVTGAINGPLEPGGEITGSVTVDLKGEPLSQEFLEEHSYSENVTARDAHTATIVRTAAVQPGGSYALNQLRTGDVELEYTATQGRYLHDYYNGRYSSTTADVLHVAAGSTYAGINETMQNWTVMHGQVLDALTENPIASVTVNLSNPNGEVFSRPTNSKGVFEIDVPEAAAYKAEFLASGYPTQFYAHRTALACAEAVEASPAVFIEASLLSSSAALTACPVQAGPTGGSPTSGSPAGGSPGGAGPGAGHVVINAAPVLKVRSNKIPLQIACAGASACKLTVDVTSSPRGRAARAARVKTVLVATARVTVAAGRTAKLSVALTRAGRRLLAAHHGRIHARVSVAGTAGAAHVSQSKSVALVQSPHR